MNVRKGNTEYKMKKENTQRVSCGRKMSIKTRSGKCHMAILAFFKWFFSYYTNKQLSMTNRFEV